jgi:hypothetical protein
MAATSLKFEDRLDGASNFLPWKARVTLLLKENDLWEIVDKVVPSLTDRNNWQLREEGDQSHAGDLGCSEGSSDSSLVREEDDQGDVRCFGKSLPKRRT